MVGASQQFGSAHTERKLQAVQKYLHAFTTALKKQSFELIYVDACAGSGSSVPRRSDDQGRLLDVDDIMVGSAVRALQIGTPFDRYILNDAKKKNARSLETVVSAGFPHLRDRVTIMRSDANEALVDICRSINWRASRAVVFLDPFGLQMDFKMITELARTRAVDLWYLVPVLGMSRQISKDGSILEPGGSRIDSLLGSDVWRNGAIVEEVGPADLFGETQANLRKVANSGWFEQVAIKQLGTVFEGGVLDEALPLGRNGLHEFSLVFACANPSTGANQLAKRLAAAVLK